MGLLQTATTMRKWLPCIICLMSMEFFILKTIRMAGRWSGCTLLTLDLATVPKHSSTICNSLQVGKEVGKKGGEEKGGRREGGVKP